MSSARYVVVKASGSNFARVIDTEMYKVLAKYNILKRGQWQLAEGYCARLNAAAAAAAEDADANECPCSFCFVRGCNGECSGDGMMGG